MATNLDLIRGALTHLGVLTEVEQPSAEQAADGLTVLNDLLEDWAGEGIEVGQYPQTDLSEDYPGPSTTVPTVKAMLAVYLASHYERPVPPTVGMIASRGYDRLIRDTVRAQIGEADTSRKLPRGDGQCPVASILTGD